MNSAIAERLPFRRANPSREIICAAYIGWRISEYGPDVTRNRACGVILNAERRQARQAIVETIPEIISDRQTNVLTLTRSPSGSHINPVAAKVASKESKLG
jgi:hypothetical protein